LNIIETMDDPKLFAKHFAGRTWEAWRVFLTALFALPMTAEQLALFRRCTGRDAQEPHPRPHSRLSRLLPRLVAILCMG
jgi:hypothetical protein